MQVKQMWHEFDVKLMSWGSEDAIRRIGNNTERDKIRFPLYKENLEGLKDE
jgi:hypothetical protein